MLACAQDLFFTNDKPLSRQDAFQSINSALQQQQQQQQQQPSSNVVSATTASSFEQQQQQVKLSKKSLMIPHHHSEKDKEEVWPPEVESAFIEALETIPKLGRRKILVNGKPCGRNELISDFIFRKTSKVRTRKQVSSHIQVLKNTRKNDPHFMRLLTDSVDLDDDFVVRKTPKMTGRRPQQQQQQKHQHQHQHQQPFLSHNTSLTLGKLATLTSAASISSDESSIHSSPSPADYVFDMMYGDDHALSMLDIKDPFYDTMHHSLFDSGLGVGTPPSSQPSSSSSALVSGISSPSTDLPSTAGTTTPDPFMHSSSTGMTTPSLVDSSYFGLSPMDVAVSDTMPSQMLPSNTTLGLQDGSTEQQMHSQHQSKYLQQQQQKQHYQLSYQQQQQTHHNHNHQHHLMHPPQPSYQLNNGDSMVEPLSRPFSQSRKWKRGNRRQKPSSTQHMRKGNQQYVGYRPSSSSSSPSSSTSPHMEAIQGAHHHPPLNALSVSTPSFCSTTSNSSNSSTMSFLAGTATATCDTPLWPNYLCLYLEYVSDPFNPSGQNDSHTLAQLPRCSPLTTTGSSALKERHTSLMQLNPSLSLIPAEATLFAKMKLDLNFNMNDFFFNNTCFFESKDRRMIECTTTIYSFGNVVLESKEMQQALWVNEDKYMYSFVYVNQFFDAFMKGVKSLQSWEEVDIAIHNLCIVQVFEDMETKCHLGENDSFATLFEPKPSSSSHLLAVVYEFERGQGTIDMATLGSS